MKQNLKTLFDRTKKCLIVLFCFSVFFVTGNPTNNALAKQESSKKVSSASKVQTNYSGVPVGEEWLADDGNHIQAHGGGFLQVDDTYYWVGENKSHNSANFYAVSLYSSNDLLNWHFEGNILTADSPTVKGAEHGLKDCKVERPKLLMNDDGKFVLYGHWEDASGYSSSQIMVATSDTVNGEYTFQGHWRPGAKKDEQYRNWRVAGNKIISDMELYEGTGVADLSEAMISDTSTFGFGSRDYTVYNDKGTGYLIGAVDHHTSHIHELTDDFTDISLADDAVSYDFMEYGREAHSVINVDGVYYVVTSGQSGWYPNMTKYISTTDLSDPNGWSELKNMGNNSSYYSQPTYIMDIPNNQGEHQYVFMGDRWNAKNLKDSRYVWLPLEIDNNTRTMDMKHEPGWYLDEQKNIQLPDVELVSRGKTIDAEVIDSSMGPELMVDGINNFEFSWDAGTQQYYKQNKEKYDFTLDLEYVYDLSRLDISFFAVNGSEGYHQYKVYGSNDNQNWDVLVDRSTNYQTSFTSDVLEGKYRYIKYENYKVINTHNGSSVAGWANGIFEFEVFAYPTDVSKELSEIPTASIDSGVYVGEQEMILSTSAKSKIYYTLDGTKPTLYSSEYKNPIKLSQGTYTLRAFSLEEGKRESIELKKVIKIHQATDIVGLVDGQSLDFAVSNTLGKSTLPKTLKAIQANNEINENANVVWDRSSLNLEELYKTQVIEGTMQGNYKITANVIVLPNGLSMFIDCGSEKTSSNSSKVFNGAKSLFKEDILHNVADQQKTDESDWGYVGSVGDPNNSNSVYGHHAGTDYLSNGWWGNASKPFVYNVSLPAGEYELESGFQEWWSSTRNIHTEVVVNGEVLGENDTIISSSTKENKATIAFVLEEDSVVEIRTSKKSNSDHVLSYHSITRKVEVVDKSELQILLDACNKLDEKDYTLSSWESFSDSIEKAQVIMDNEDATSEEVSNAIIELNEAKSSLVVVSEKYEELHEILINCESIFENEKEYTTESFEKFVQTYEEARKVDRRDDEEIIVKSIASLKDAIDNLKKNEVKPDPNPENPNPENPNPENPSPENPSMELPEELPNTSTGVTAPNTGDSVNIHNLIFLVLLSLGLTIVSKCFKKV